MSKTIEDINDIEIPTAETITHLRKAFYSDESNLMAAKEYASELYCYYLEEDDSDEMLSKTKCELEYIHNLFPNDREIAENYADAISLWAMLIGKSDLNKVKKEVFLLLRTFPQSEDIAENYAELLVEVSNVKTPLNICYTRLANANRLKRYFTRNNRIKEACASLEKTIKTIQEYLLLSQGVQALKERYESNPCLKNALKYAEYLCKIIPIESDEVKCYEYSDTINFFVQQYPDCVDLIEQQAVAIYHLAESSESYYPMREASSEIQGILNKYPSNERLAEIYVRTLDYLCEDEDNLEKTLREIEKYYHLYQDSLAIVSSYAGALAVYAEGKSRIETEQVLDLIWSLYIQTNADDIYEAYKQLFDCYNDMLPKRSNCLSDYYPNYFEWLETPILQIEKDTGKVIREYGTIIEACKNEKITPTGIIHALGATTKPDDLYYWIMP